MLASGKSDSGAPTRTLACLPRLSHPLLPGAIGCEAVRLFKVRMQPC